MVARPGQQRLDERRHRRARRALPVRGGERVGSRRPLPAGARERARPRLVADKEICDDDRRGGVVQVRIVLREEGDEVGRDLLATKR